MSRSLKPPIEAVSDIVLPESSGFLDIVGKFGPLVIAIIAVAFCFYVYKKVNENCNFEFFKLFIEEQTNTNYKIQESYNNMVEQFNALSNIVHSSTLQKSTVESQLSPLSTKFIEEEQSIVDTNVPEQPIVDAYNSDREILDTDNPEQAIVDDNSDISFVSKSESSKKLKKSRKNAVN